MKTLIIVSLLMTNTILSWAQAPQEPLVFYNRNYDPTKVWNSYSSKLETIDWQPPSAYTAEDSAWIDYMKVSYERETFMEILEKKEKGRIEKMMIAAPFVEDIIYCPLVIGGDTIEERYSTKSSPAIAQVTCINNKPTIVYFKNKKVTDIAMAFFKLHEYSHFLLGHKTCGSNSSPDRENEFAADCHAVGLLLTKQFKDGSRVVDYTAATLRLLYGSGGRSHPSGRERHDKIYTEECGQSVIP
jgi:hypothetical protein